MVVQHQLPYIPQVYTFEAFYGYSPPLISEVMVPRSESLVEFLTQKQQMIYKLKENLSQAQARIKKFTDKKRSERVFAVRDLVYLKLQPYMHTAFGLHQNLKLTTKYYDPFRIMEKLSYLHISFSCLALQISILFSM
jgi:hypothetical protein